jgi:hypothetical protein
MWSLDDMSAGPPSFGVWLPPLQPADSTTISTTTKQLLMS